MQRNLEHHQLPLGRGSNLKSVLLVKYKYRSGDAARNSMFIVAEASIFWVCKQWHICIIRLIRDATMDWYRYSREGSFHAGEERFCQGRHGE
jgi:hypothetical protein